MNTQKPKDQKEKDLLLYRGMIGRFFKNQPDFAARGAAPQEGVPLLLMVDEAALTSANTTGQHGELLGEMVTQLGEHGVNVKIVFQGQGTGLDATEGHPALHEGGPLRRHSLDAEHWRIPPRAIGNHIKALQNEGHISKNVLHYTSLEAISGPGARVRQDVVLNTYTPHMMVQKFLTQAGVAAGILPKPSHAFTSEELATMPEIENKLNIGGKAYGLAQIQQIAAKHPESGIKSPGFLVLGTHHSKAELGLGMLDMAEESGWEHLVRQRAKEAAAEGTLDAVRSGAPASMPGMLHTVKNVGMTTSKIAEGFNVSQEEGVKRLLAYQVLVGSFQKSISETDPEKAEKLTLLINLVEEAVQEGALSAQALQAMQRNLGPLPDEVEEQYVQATKAVMTSWSSESANRYREKNDIPDDIGTAVIVQKMVQPAFAGVVFTHDLATGEEELSGNYGRGEDVVAGKGNTHDMGTLAREYPEVYAKLEAQVRLLQTELKQPLDVEFTVDEGGELFLLQQRKAVLTPEAQLNVLAKNISTAIASQDRKTAQEILLAAESILAENPQLAHAKKLTPTEEKPFARGEVIAAAVTTGTVVAPNPALNPAAAFRKVHEQVREADQNGTPVILALKAEDYQLYDTLIGQTAGVLLTDGGNKASHASVLARKHGVLCLGEIERDGKTLTPASLQGQRITIDNTGEIYLGALPLEDAPPPPALAQLRKVAERAPEEVRATLPRLTNQPVREADFSDYDYADELAQERMALDASSAYTSSNKREQKELAPSL